MNFLVYLLFIVLEKIVPLFPLSFTRRIARLKGILFYYIIPIRKKTALQNVRLAFPGKNEEQVRAIVKYCYINVLIVITEFFYIPKLKLNALKETFKISNPEIIKEKLKDGKGLILISAHFGNWELGAYAIGRICGEPLNVIVKEQSNTLVDKEINEIREVSLMEDGQTDNKMQDTRMQGNRMQGNRMQGNKMIDMRNSLREVLTLLKENKIVAMLGDQAAPKENVKVNFFIKDVPTFEGTARFAIKTGAAVLFGVPVRNDDYSYAITFREIDMNKYKEYNDQNVKALTQEHTNMLVEMIKENPGHWLWFHKRFKNTAQ